jgi:hypothetical protein
MLAANVLSVAIVRIIQQSKLNTDRYRMLGGTAKKPYGTSA